VTGTYPTSARDVLGSLAGAPVRAGTYRNLAYLVLSFPLGIGYFTFVVAGLSAGVALVPVLVGVPLLVGVLIGAYWVVSFDRWLATRLLGADVPPVEVPDLGDGGFVDSVRALVTAPLTWIGLGYLLARFAVGVGAFVLLTVVVVVPATLLAAPLVYEESAYVLGPWVTVDTLGEALGTAVLGLVLVPIGLAACNAFALGCRVLTEAALDALPAALDGGAAGDASENQ
jgi:hypothetical protein